MVLLSDIVAKTSNDLQQMGDSLILTRDANLSGHPLLQQSKPPTKKEPIRVHGSYTYLSQNVVYLCDIPNALMETIWVKLN